VTTHLYCVLPNERRGELPSDLRGIDGARVRSMQVEGLVAWVSDGERGVPVSIDEVRAHDAVVEAALETGATPVPARFGQEFASDDACRGALENYSDSVTSLLADMQGFVEMTLILTPSTRRMLRDLEPVLPAMLDPAKPGAGREYMESLREREAATGAVRRSLDSLAQRLTEATKAFVRRRAVHDQVTRLPLRTISHLVSRSDVANYKEATHAVSATSELRFLVIGPRAPYSFCALGNRDTGLHGMKLAD
jgi:gas vesicle protein GvpL/GvpF